MANKKLFYSQETLIHKLNNIIPSEIINIDDSLDQRIFFTPVDLDGLEDMHEYSIKPDFYKYMEGLPPKTIKDTHDYILKLKQRNKKGYAGGECMYWFIRLCSSKKVIGSISLLGVNIPSKNAETGIGLSSSYNNSGYIFEALYYVLKFSFEILQLDKIYAHTMSDNLSLIRLYELIGFKVEGILREHYLKHNGTRKDATVVGLIKKEAYLTKCKVLAKISFV